MGRITAMTVVAFCIGMMNANPTRLIDMSHILDSNSMLWGAGIQKSPNLTDITARVGVSASWNGNNFEVGEHVGTHIDAPKHMKTSAGTHYLHDMSLEDLTGPAVRIDVRHKLTSQNNNNYEVTSQDLVDFEAKHGRIPDGAIVVLCSGWYNNANSSSLYWGNPEGIGISNNTSYPGFGLDSAQWLIDRRDIRGLATDTGSCDVGNSTTFDAHRLLFDKNKWCAEGLTKTCDIPPQGATIYAFPMKIRDASGIPLRVVASVDDAKYPNGASGLEPPHITAIGLFFLALTKSL